MRFQKYISLLAISATVTFTSCDSVDDSTVDYSAASQAQPVLITPPSTQAAVKAAGLTPRAGVVRLNPAHGQPGHSCDVEVGAPLPSAAPVQANTVTTAQSTTAATGNVKINPAHGQPGHICSIPVGDPLPSTASAQPVPSPNTSAPSLVPNTLPSMNTNARINPAHGQPGHDCSVAVGAPLPG